MFEEVALSCGRGHHVRDRTSAGHPRVLFLGRGFFFFSSSRGRGGAAAHSGRRGNEGCGSGGWIEESEVRARADGACPHRAG